MTRILIVEDEPSLSEPLAFLLGREGYETTIAADGPAAIVVSYPSRPSRKARGSLSDGSSSTMRMRVMMIVLPMMRLPRAMPRAA